MRKFYYFRASPDDYGNIWVLGIFPHLNAFNWKGGGPTHHERPDVTTQLSSAPELGQIGASTPLIVPVQERLSSQANPPVNLDEKPGLRALAILFRRWLPGDAC
jgi:hypothetical protein